jgi:hypothetical protein
VCVERRRDARNIVERAGRDGDYEVISLVVGQRELPAMRAGAAATEPPPSHDVRFH